MCENAWRCFGFILNTGLRQGGGIGDALSFPNPSKIIKIKKKKKKFFKMKYK